MFGAANSDMLRAYEPHLTDPPISAADEEKLLRGVAEKTHERATRYGARHAGA